MGYLAEWAYDQALKQEEPMSDNNVDIYYDRKLRNTGEGGATLFLIDGREQSQFINQRRT